jgi:hypothetical protein
LTDHYKTQCFSTHLTTFTSSFLILPFSIYEKENLRSLEDKLDFEKNFTQWFLIHTEYIFKQIDQLWVRYFYRLFDDLDSINVFSRI